MDSVNLFNSELSSLYDVKPPISKGKMTAITKAALKAVKFYKHVVQSVEKFIQKCKAEYKIPGLYVIDSIIRQSRHQFGSDKDIFAGRFQRNLQTTFVYLYRCPEEDKSKVIRVLNLWQKNRIFLPEAIQPLFDLADPNNPIWESVQQQLGQDYGGNDNISSQPSLSLNQNDQYPVHFKKELLDYDYDEEDDMDGDGAPSGVPHPAPPPPQLSQVHNAVTTHHSELTQSALSGFDALGTILTNPEVLRQLQTLQEQMAAAAQQQHLHQQHQQQGYLTPELERQRKLAELNKQEAAFDQRLAQTVARLPFAVECDLPFTEAAESRRSPNRENSGGMGVPPPNLDQNSNHQHNSGLLLPPPFFHQLNPEHLQQMLPPNSEEQQHHMNMLANAANMSNPFGIPLNFPIQNAPPMHYQHQSQQHSNQFNAQQLQEFRDVGFPLNFKPDQPPPFEVNYNEDMGREDHRERDRRDRGLRAGERRVRSRSRSGSASQRRNSRSNSRTRNRKRHPRSRSRSRDRKEDKEREKERQRKGLPSIKKEHLSICSTTLWVGHLSKLVTQEEISDTFGAYGDVVSIDLISPRGCAFVVMNRRQDACRALDRLRNSKLQSKAITLAWAPGKGVKGRDWKDYWEVDAGVSYIPWSRLKTDTNLEEFEDGGSIDEDSLPDFMKKQYKAITSKEEKKEELETTKPQNSEVAEDTKHLVTNHSAAPIANISALLAPSLDQLKAAADTDARPASEMTVAAQHQTINQIGQPQIGVPQFGMPPPGSMMGVSSMAMNMMMPPPMLGSPMCLPHQFQNMNALPGINLPMMGMIPPNMGPRMSHDPSMKPLSGGQGLLGEMPMPPQSLNVSINNANNSQEFVERMIEENRKRAPDERRENREKKRSRFDDADDRNSPPQPNIDQHSPQNFDRLKDGPPLFERLKNIAGGYAFGAQGNNDKLGMANSLLGTPIGPGKGIGIGPRGAMEPHGFPSPLGRGHPGQFGVSRGGPFPGDRQAGIGPRPWFDVAQNPFVNPNSQNPFAGNPFIQQGGGNPNENPFEFEARHSGGGDRGRGQFFGEQNHFSQRGGGRGWSRGDGPPVSNDWRGQSRGGPRGGRGGPGPGGPGRGAPSWRGRNQDEDLGPRDIERDRDGGRGFRGGRGRENRDRGNDFDRSNERRRDWDRGRSDRDNRDPPGRERDRDNRERDRDFRDRGRDRDVRDIGNSRDNRVRPTEESSGPPKVELEKVGPDEENWDDNTGIVTPQVGHQSSGPQEENWDNNIQPPVNPAVPVVRNEKTEPEIPARENTPVESCEPSNHVKVDSDENSNLEICPSRRNDFSPHYINNDMGGSSNFEDIEPESPLQGEGDHKPEREEHSANLNGNNNGNSVSDYSEGQQYDESSFKMYSREAEKNMTQPSAEINHPIVEDLPLPLMGVNSVDSTSGGGGEYDNDNNVCTEVEPKFEQNNFKNSQVDLKTLDVDCSKDNTMEVTTDAE